MSRIRFGLIRLVLAGLLLAAPLGVPAAASAASPESTAAAVAEGVAGEVQEHAKGGLPQLNTETFPTQIFWLVVTFGLLFYLMSKVALPRVGEVLAARQEKVASDLDRASALKAEADTVIAGYEQALTEARRNAQKVLGEATAMADAEAARRNGDLAGTLADRARAAEERIAAAKQAALENVRGIAAETAQAAVAKLAGLDVQGPTAEAAVGAALADLSRERA